MVILKGGSFLFSVNDRGYTVNDMWPKPAFTGLILSMAVFTKSDLH